MVQPTNVHDTAVALYMRPATVLYLHIKTFFPHFYCKFKYKSFNNRFIGTLTRSKQLKALMLYDIDHYM